MGNNQEQARLNIRFEIELSFQSQKNYVKEHVI